MFRNSILVAMASVALSACSSVTQPIVTNGDLTSHLEKQGYSKVLIRNRMSCGKAGQGRYFIGTKSGKAITGQICYLKRGDKVTYAVDEIKPKPTK